MYWLLIYIGTGMHVFGNYADKAECLRALGETIQGQEFMHGACIPSPIKQPVDAPPSPPEPPHAK